MSSRSSARERIRRLVDAARRIADPTDPLGVEARRVLPASTGLSAQGVALALEAALESNPSEAEVSSLIASVEQAPRAHVLLSANVFVGAHRALALALAASSVVRVRPSRRETTMVRLLDQGAPGSFEIVDTLTPVSGDRFWAYGTDATLRDVQRALPSGVEFHPHGPGLGVVALGVGCTASPYIDDLARRVAHDVILFDQRGCLSPRVVAASGSIDEVRGFARALASELVRAEVRFPRGLVTQDEAAAAVRYRDTLLVGGELLPAGAGWVGLDVSGQTIVVPPPGRHVHVLVADEPLRKLASLEGRVTSLAVENLSSEIPGSLSGARRCSPGEMQAPPFDGPVDRRVPVVIHSRP